MGPSSDQGQPGARAHRRRAAGHRPRAAPLVHREAELERIAMAVGSARTGRGRTLALEGSAGIGKTRLLRAATELAQTAGHAVITASGGQMETDLAFGVVRQLFEPALASAGARGRQRLSARAAGAAAPLFDDVDPEGHGRDRGFATLDALLRLTADLGTRTPLLVVVDDAHWADDPSLRFLAYLARRVHGLPVALMVAVRPEDPGARRLLLTELIAGPDVDVVRPLPLAPDAVGALLREEFDGDALEPGFVDGCWTTTGGNPFLLTQLIRTLRDGGLPPSPSAIAEVGRLGLATVSGWVHLRVAGLPPSAAALAAAAAVLGGGADPQLAAHLAGLDRASADEALDGLVAVGILREADGLTFVHPLVRSAIYAELPPRRRSRAHREAARLLLGAGARSQQVASHLMAAAPAGDDAVAAVLLDAARSAARGGAPDLAARYLRRALAEPPPDASRPQLLRELGIAEQSAGQFEAAADDLRRALGCTGDIATRIELGLRLRYALVWCDRAREVAGAVDGVIAEAAGREPAGALLLEAAVAGAQLVDLSTSDRERSRARAITRPALAGASVPPHISSLAAVVALFANEPAERVIGLAEEAERGWQTVPPFARGSMTAQLFFTLVFAEDFSLARRLLDREVEDARRHGSVAQFLNAAAFRAMLRYRTGALVEAEADARAALEAAHLHAGTGQPDGAPAPSLHAPMALAVLLEVMIERGETSQAERLVAQTGAARAASHLVLFAFLVAARARLRMTQRRAPEAAADLLALGRRMEGRIASPGVVAWRSQAALALAEEGRGDPAGLAREELRLARALGAPRALGVALRAAALTGPGDERLALLSEAEAVLHDSPSRLEHARALVELGAELRRRGTRLEARRVLGRGMDGAHGCGATALAQRAREELRLLGLRPRRLALTGVAALTGAERRVAGMAAQGLTNRQIAQALVVSVSTVETHLRHVFEKLGIDARGRLAEHVAGPWEDAPT